jgi:hypothetical protein
MTEELLRCVACCLVLLLLPHRLRAACRRRRRRASLGSQRSGCELKCWQLGVLQRVGIDSQAFERKQMLGALLRC